MTLKKCLKRTVKTKELVAVRWFPYSGVFGSDLDFITG